MHVQQEQRRAGGDYLLFIMAMCQIKVYLYKVKDFSNAFHYHCNRHLYQKLQVHVTLDQIISVDVSLQN